MQPISGASSANQSPVLKTAYATAKAPRSTVDQGAIKMLKRKVAKGK